MDKRKKLSIVCAVFNGERVLGRLLDSFRSQAVNSVELIVVDAASTDGTMAIMEINSDIISISISEPDSGIYDAWNKALAISSADFISFIGADDRIAPGAIQALLDAIETVSNDVNLIAGFNVLTIDGIPIRLLTSQYSASELTWKMPLAQLMSAHRRSWMLQAGGFDATYRSSGDYELLIRERARVKVNIIPVIFAFMEEGGISGRGLRPFFEDYRARVTNGLSRIQAIAILFKAFIGYALRTIGLRR